MTGRFQDGTATPPVPIAASQWLAGQGVAVPTLAFIVPQLVLGLLIRKVCDVVAIIQSKARGTQTAVRHLFNGLSDVVQRDTDSTQ